MDEPLNQQAKVLLSFTLEGKFSDKAICKVCGLVVERPQEIFESGFAFRARLWNHLEKKHKEVSKLLSALKSNDLVVDTIEKLNVKTIQKSTEQIKGYTSKIWKHYEVSKENKNISICRECKEHIWRGFDRGTTSMWKHIKLKHPDTFKTAQYESDENLEEEPEELTLQKDSVKDEFLLHNVRQNAYICKTCGMIMRLDSPLEFINTSRLVKHLDHIFHKRVQHGLEPPKRIPKLNNKRLKLSNTDNPDPALLKNKTLPAPIPSEKIISSREVDLIHSAVMMRTLYMQQQRDLCCDCTILIPHKEKPKQNGNKKISANSKNDTVKYYETDTGYEFKVHSCVLAIISDKMKTLLDSVSTSTIMVHDVTKDAILSFIEIAYLGKLKNLIYLEEKQIWDIYLAANSFNSSLVVKYLERECMHVIEKYSSENPNQSYSKFSVYLSKDSQKDHDQEDLSTDSAKEDEDSFQDSDDNINEENEQVSLSGLSLLGISEKLKTSLPNKRKRPPPLAPKIKLKIKTPPRKRKNARKNVQVELKPHDVESQSQSQNNIRVEDAKPRFEIQGDTAILRMESPEHSIGNGLNSDHNYTEKEEIR